MVLHLCKCCIASFDALLLHPFACRFDLMRAHVVNQFAKLSIISQTAKKTVKKFLADIYRRIAVNSEYNPPSIPNLL